MRTTLVLCVGAMFSLAACSSDGSDANSESAQTGAIVATDWTEAQDVLDGLDAEGFACKWTGTGDQIIDESPISGEPADVVVIRCDGYGVALGSGEEGWYSMILPECEPLTENDRNSPLASAPIVLGSNFAVLGAEAAATFPEDAPAEDFIAAFGGELITFLDLYERVCNSE